MTEPITARITVLPLILFSLLLAIVAGCQSTDPSSAVGTFGNKLTTRGERELKLELGADGSATMTATFAQGMQSVQTGNWVADGDSVNIKFSRLNGFPQQNEITFKLERGNLVPTKWDPDVYDVEILRLARF
ncbi:MAG: hypothetical protein EXR58_05355 [Chloroflexi bacterium]|nr:hypothetical protein [Chloroflexota bacterium]